MKALAAALVLATAGVALFILLVLNGPAWGSFAIILVGFAGFMLLVVASAVIVRATQLRLRDSLVAENPDSVIFVTERTPLLTEELVALPYSDELGAGLTVDAFPKTFMAQADECGLILWAGSARQPRKILAIVWADFPLISQVEGIVSGSNRRSALRVSDGTRQLTFVVLGGVLDGFTASGATAARLVEQVADQARRHRGYSIAPVPVNSVLWRRAFDQVMDWPISFAEGITRDEVGRAVSLYVDSLVETGAPSTASGVLQDELADISKDGLSDVVHAHIDDFSQELADRFALR